MVAHPSWNPADDKTVIFNDRTWFAGMVLSAVAYGIVFTLFVLTFQQLIRTTMKQNYTQRLPFLIYITLMFILGTVYVGSIAKMGELSFIDYPLFPGGPGPGSLPINIMAAVSYVIANWLTNLLLVRRQSILGSMWNLLNQFQQIYRYLVIFRNTRHLPLLVVMLIPVLAYMTSLGTFPTRLLLSNV
jgi:hypothetical protein